MMMNSRRSKNLSITSSYVKPSNVKSGAGGASKKKKKRRGGRVPRGVSMNNGAFKVQTIRSLTEVIGSRLNCSCASTDVVYYDSNSQRMIPSRFVTRALMTTIGTTGYGAVKVQPHLKNQYSTGTTNTEAVINSWTDVNASGYQTAPFSSYRIVSICVEYTAMTIPEESSGIITVVVTPPQAEAGSVSDDFDIASTMYTDVEFVRQYQASLCICPNPEGPEGRIHKPIDSTDADGWPYVYIGLRAGTKELDTAVGEVVVTTSVELHVNTDTAYNWFLQAPGAALPQLEAAISRAQGTVTQIVDESTAPGLAKRTFWGAAEDAAIELVDSLAPIAISAMLAMI